MAKSKKPSGQLLKSIKAGLATLKRKGLFSGDVRKATGGWRQKSLLKRFADVVSGKATTVKVGKAAADFDPSYRAKSGRIVVQAEKGETFRFNKRLNAVTSRRESYGVKLRRILPGVKVRTADDLPKSKNKNKQWFYKVPHNPTRDYRTMQEEIRKYANKKGYTDAIEIYEYDPEEYDPEPMAAKIIGNKGEYYLDTDEGMRGPYETRKEATAALKALGYE